MQQNVNQNLSQNYNFVEANQSFDGVFCIRFHVWFFRPVLRKTSVKVIPGAFRRRQGKAASTTVIWQPNDEVWSNKSTSCFHKVIDDNFEKIVDCKMNTWFGSQVSSSWNKWQKQHSSDE